MGHPIRTVYLDRNSTLWIGSKGDGVRKIYNYDINANLANCKTEAYTTSNSALADNSIYTISKSKHGGIWIGSEGGINYYSENENKIKSIKLEYNKNQIKYVHDIHEQDSVLWIATAGMGIIRAHLKWHGNNPILTPDKHIILIKPFPTAKRVGKNGFRKSPIIFSRYLLIHLQTCGSQTGAREFIQ